MSVSCGQSPFVLVKVVLSNLSKKNRDSSFQTLCQLFAQYGSEVASFALEVLAQGLDLRQTESTHKVKRKLFLELVCLVAVGEQLDRATCLLPALEEVTCASGGIKQVFDTFSQLSLSSALAVASCLLLSSKSFVRESCLAFLSEQQLKVPDYLSAGYYVSLASVQHPALELLNHSSLDILPPLTSTVFSHLAESVMSTLSLAQVIRNAGYSATASVEDFQQLLLRFQPLRESDVSTIIATMSSTLRGLSDFHDQSSGRTLSGWDEVVCGRAFSAIMPSLNWAPVLALMDTQAQFSVTEASVRFIVSVVRAFHSSSGGTFPVRYVYAQIWPNSSHQHAFIRFLVSLRIEGVSFATTPERTTSFVDEPLGANSPWGNADFLERYIQLSALGAEQHRSNFDEACRRFPQTILGSLLKFAESTWPPLASDIATSLFQRFIVQLPQSANFFKTLFSTNPRGFSVLLVSNYRKDPQCLPNVARLAITIREVSTILAVCPSAFAAELAIAAGRAEALSIENWLISALNDRHDKDDLAGFMIASLQSKIADLPPEVVVGVIRAIRSSPRLSQNTQNEAHSFVESNQARFPFLTNEFAEIAGAATVSNPANVNLPPRNFAPNVEELSNSNFQRIYAGELTIEQAIQMLRDMQASSVQFDNEVFKCMIHSLLDEYRYFGQYPDRELKVTGHIFGALIEHRVLPAITNNVALKYILESLRRNAHNDAARTDVNMFRFGMWALERARSRLREWPQYCALLQQNRQIEQVDAELYRYICSCAGAVSRSNGPNAASIEEPLAPAPASRAVVTQPSARQPIASPARPPSSVPAPSTPYAFVASTVNLNRAFGDSPMFGTAMNANSLLDALPTVASPDESERDKIHFIFNNLSLSNIDLKHRELSEVCRENHFPYLSQYLVAKRVAVEANYHGLYVQFMEKFEGNAQKVIFAVVVDTTLQCVRVLLHRDRVGQAASNGGERTMIKNLGSWLGMLTLARNKPLLFDQLDLKGLMTNAFRSGHLFVVIPFVAKLLESCKNSVIFRPPNPWTNAMLGVLAELHPMPNLKLNIKFEVEVLCKNLEVDLTHVRPASILGRPNPDANNLDWSSVDVQGLMSDSSSAVGSISPSTAPSIAGQALTAQMPQLVISASVDLFRQQPALRMYAQTAIRNAIQEMIAPVVERSVTIACITAREMLVKDLAFETDEGRLRHAAHLAVKHLAGSLALVTCKEHLRQSICQNLRNFLMQAQNTVDHAVLEQTVQTIAHENVDIGCAAIESRAVEKAIQDIDQAVNLLVEDRRQRGRPGDPIFALRSPSRFLEQLPEALRPSPGGLTQSQAAIYEAFSQLPRPVTTVPASSIVASESINPVRLSPDDAALRAFSTFEAASSSPELSSVSSQIRQVIDRSSSPSDAANSLAKKLLEYFSSNQTSASQNSAHNFTSCLTVCRETSPNLPAFVLDWFQRQPDSVRLKKDLVLCLKNSNCVDFAEIDAYFSENLASSSSAISSFVRTMQSVSSGIFPRSVHALSLLETVPLQSQSQQLQDSLADLGHRYHLTVNAEGNRGGAIFILDEWTSLLSRNPTEAVISVFVHQIRDAGIIAGDSATQDVFKYLTEISLRRCSELLASAAQSSSESSPAYVPIDSFAKFLLALGRILNDPSRRLHRGNLTGVVAKAITNCALEEFKTQRNQFDQRPYHRLLVDIVVYLTEPTAALDPTHGDTLQYKVLHSVASVLHTLQPSHVPAFAFAWLEVFSHRCFMPRLLQVRNGWPLMDGLLYDLLLFMEPHIRLNDMAEPVSSLYKGILRVLLVLLHDFPDFLSENHVHLLQAIPSQAIQIRNLICSAMPRAIRPPDPFTPNLQVDLLPDVRRPPAMKTDVSQILSTVIRGGNSNLRVDLEAWIQNGNPAFLESLPGSLVDNPSGRGEFRFNNSVLNALVIFMANADLTTWPSRQNSPAESNILSRKSIDLFASLSLNLDHEGRFQLFSALANQLRFPNAHTHHACTILLFLFRELQPQSDAHGHIQEQITRVLMERLILLKPHPWGVLITFIELIRNPTYNFWAYEFVRAPSDINSIFQSVARNCLNTQQAAAVLGNRMDDQQAAQ